ncbi:MAG: flagellar biosynthesis anti-sigma factor FlgM [Candidatus Krumholzibacteriia bacterium]
MAMDRINGSPLVRPNILDQFQTTRKGEEKAEGPVSAVGAAMSQGKPTADKAEISDAARELVDLRQAVETGRAALAELPEVRPERVAEVQQRLERGYYQSIEVMNMVAERIMGVVQAMEMP